MAHENKIYNRTKAVFVTRFLVLLDKFKEDFVAQLVAESIKESIETLYPVNGKFARVQKNNRRIILDKIKKLIILYLEK
jgi:hypothetical protein